MSTAHAAAAAAAGGVVVVAPGSLLSLDVCSQLYGITIARASQRAVRY
jgi:hypothetical protein